MKGHSPTPNGPRRNRMATICAFLAGLIVVHHVGAQSVGSAVSPTESPDTAELANRSLKLNFSTAPVVLRIELPAADTASQRSKAEARDHRPLQIGFPRAIPSEYRGDLSPLIDWTPLDDGSIAGAVSVTSPGAQALRAAIRAELGSGGEIRFFDGNTADGDTGQVSASQDFPVVIREDFYDDGEPEILWSPTVEGDTIGIEITLPSREALSDFSLSIEQVSHIYVPMESLGYVPKELECPNHIDVQCRVGSFSSNYDSAVARIDFVDDGYSYNCSGTLLNDSEADTFIPYFLTANHCVSTGTVARTVEARWFWQRASCGNASIDSRHTTTFGGTDLLETSVAQDSTLLQFKSSLPGELFYSGWSADPISHPTQVYGIHHPDGDVKKFSAGRTIRHRDGQVCEDPENDIGCFTVRDGIDVAWSDGTTELGSSGSGLFSGPYLIGALSGGDPGCTNSEDFYGSFQDFYPKISRWLGSDNTTPPTTSARTLPFVPPASNVEPQGFVRIINNSNRAGEVTITAIDDEGERHGPVTLSLEARAAQHFNSEDLEDGNPDKGLSEGVGKGDGNWRLKLETNLDIEHLAYIRTEDGFVTNMHEVAAEIPEGSNRYHVPFLNPGSNTAQVSKLRLINPGSGDASIEITGVDDDGRTLGPVSLDLDAGMARILTASELESGESPHTQLTGDLGDGTGKWRLSVSADRPIQVMSLLQLPSGHLTNLSRGQDGVSVPPPPPPGQPDLIVESPSADPATPSAGQLVLLSATVRNQGGTQSAATRLRFYRSSDATISRSDTALQDASVSALPPSGTSSSAISVTAPSASGTYYYGACVDEVSGESNTANNCSDAVRVVVSGGSRSCIVTLDRSGANETVSIRQSDARQTGIGTIADPFVVRARMDSQSDVDSYRIDLRQTSELYIVSVGGLDTEAVFLADNCTEVGTVVRDLGITFPNDFDPTNYNFAVVGDLSAGTYYLVVYEWERRVGPYALGVGVDNSSGGVGTGRLEPIEGWNSLIDRLDSDGVGGRN